MRRRKLIAAAIVAAAAAATVAVLVPAAGSAPRASAVTVKVMDLGTKYTINRSATDTMYFAPAVISIPSGQTLTFEYGGKPSSEPHTMTIVPQEALPRTSAQIDNCTVCERYASGHLKNPKAPPGPTNDIAHWTLNTGGAGFDGPGDSIAIEGPQHRSITVQVSAPAGTVLHFICAVHPWMQGTIKVT